MPDSCANGQGDWRDIVVSYVPNAWETKTTDISLGAALEKIRNGRWAKPVARIREKYVEVLAQVDPHLFSFQLTSNGFQATTDLTNRSCIIRILKRNGHAFKTYGSPLINILGHVKAEQARFLSATYSVVNEWSAHGMPMSSDTRGQGVFRPWWQIIDWITLNLACLPSPLEGHQAARAGASNPTLGWLREIFLKLSSQSRLEEPLSASEIAEFCAIHEELKIPGLQASADEEEALRHIGRLMATAFKTGDTVQGEEFEVHRTQETRFVESINQTREFKKYTFHRAQPAH